MIRASLIAAALVAGLASAAHADSSVAVSNAWARATPEGAKAGAAYVTITNKGTTPDTLVSVATPVASEPQLHTMIDDNGVMKMRPVDGIAVKPGESVTLKPGGYHVMLLGLKQPLKQGDSFPLTLHFAQAGDISTTVTVAKVGAMGPGASAGSGASGGMGTMSGMGGK